LKIKGNTVFLQEIGLFEQKTGIMCWISVDYLGQYRTNRQESLARDFSSEKGGKPQEYFVYFKVLLTHF